MTIHAGITKELAIRALKSKRIIPIVSRGGDMIAGWMIHNNSENPYRKTGIIYWNSLKNTML